MLSRSNCLYKSCYCEENVYKLTENPYFEKYLDCLYVVFISNPTKSVAVWLQQLSKDDSRPVVWDYHVILLVKPSGSSNAGPLVYDLDTKLPFPCAANDYIEYSFLPTASFPDKYRQWFRVVPVALFRRRFASDRSHMLLPVGDVSVGDNDGAHHDSSDEPRWSMPPPPWGCIIAEDGSSMNLFRWMDMTQDVFTALPPNLGATTTTNVSRANSSIENNSTAAVVGRDGLVEGRRGDGEEDEGRGAGGGADDETVSEGRRRSDDGGDETRGRTWGEWGAVMPLDMFACWAAGAEQDK